MMNGQEKSGSHAGNGSIRLTLDLTLRVHKQSTLPDDRNTIFLSLLSSIAHKNNLSEFN
jgi:hypothetical protein